MKVGGLIMQGGCGGAGAGGVQESEAKRNMVQSGHGSG